MLSIWQLLFLSNLSFFFQNSALLELYHLQLLIFGDTISLCCEFELQAASVDAVATLLKNDLLTLETLVSSFFCIFFLILLSILSVYVFFEIDIT